MAPYSPLLPVVALLLLAPHGYADGVVEFQVSEDDAYPLHSVHHDGRGESEAFSNQWVVHLTGGQNVADLIALRHGYDNQGEVPGFPDHYLMSRNDQNYEMRSESTFNTDKLKSETRVVWAEQLFHKDRVKRIPEFVVYEEENDDAYSSQRADLDDYYRVLRALGAEEARGIPADLLALWDEEERAAKRKHGIPVPPKSNEFNDLLWDHQWYMKDTRMRSNLPELSLNILPVFEMGYTGKGVRVCVLDDGLERSHDDLKDNYDPEISFDYQNGTHGDPDPSPVYGQATPNSHGTRCAGEIAMKANNHVCGVGVAHGAKIGGIRMLDGKINDRLEGLSLQHAIDKIDIFTASWGPRDDGKTVEGPGHMAMKALNNGIKNGRGGKGSIYVWASGNGGQHGDNCNCDGYTSSIYTTAIGSASEHGDFPWYGERCSSTLAATYSSGAYSDQKIATTDNNNTCTVSHTGTSAAAPLAAGIIALALEANPSLTWRDVQHLIVNTASAKPLADNPGWQTNGAGHAFNSRFGFGLMDAEKMVRAAENWKTVGKQRVEKYKNIPIVDRELRSGDAVSVEFKVPATTKVRHLEHVEVRSNVAYPVRGALEVVLVSPRGTISQLLTTRPKDESDAGFKDWKFMSVHFWGENSSGNWSLHALDRVSQEERKGSVGDFELILYGTKKDPNVAAVKSTE